MKKARGGLLGLRTNGQPRASGRSRGQRHLTVSGGRQLLSMWRGSLLTSWALAKSANVNTEGVAQGVLSEPRVSTRGSQKSFPEHPASPGSPGQMWNPREGAAFGHGDAGGREGRGRAQQAARVWWTPGIAMPEAGNTVRKWAPCALALATRSPQGPKAQEPRWAAGGSPGTLILCQREGPVCERRVRRKTPTHPGCLPQGPDSGWLSEREDSAGGLRIQGARP